MPRLLLATQQPFYPDAAGGSQRSALEILRGLQGRGWEVGVVCSAGSRRWLPGRLWARRRDSGAVLAGSPWARRDDSLGFPVWRSFPLASLRGGAVLHHRLVVPWFERLLDAFAPDVVLGDRNAACPLLLRSLALGIPGVYLARSLPRFDEPTILPPHLTFVANSPYTARVLVAITGRDVPVVRPMVPRHSYEVAGREPERVTLVNPIPHKGLDIALEVARRLPEQPFLFVKGRWGSLRGAQVDAYARRAAALPNVEVLDFCDDMRQVYRRTRVLLVPSQFLETFGRVILEAHINGIPVVASDVGGVAETVGQGGILVRPKENVEGYADALRSLADPAEYERFSTAALENSRREELDPLVQLDELVRALETAIATRPTSR
jgi:glycosyltransferase involved in cell wall biosynthesis